MDSAVTDLPEPDSPTSATVSPRPMVKSSDFTARYGLARAPNSTLRPSTASSVSVIKALRYARLGNTRGDIASMLRPA
ncbi:hypothetical protein G6F59_018871 [Rhizopus arrhizus]|nr:hypothetical protein G6F59_018871 [Rhizopus arrhizus]